MKTIRPLVYLFVAGLLFVTSCQSSTAASDIAIRPDTTLTNEQIEQKLADFRSLKATDAMPTDVVAAKFKSQFGAAYDLEWETASGVYEVEFKLAHVDYKAWYDADANLLQYRHDLATRHLPAVVKDAVKQKYPKFRMDDAEKFFKGTEVFYEVSIEKSKQELKVYYKEDGTFIKERLD